MMSRPPEILNAVNNTNASEAVSVINNNNDINHDNNNANHDTNHDDNEISITEQEEATPPPPPLLPPPGSIVTHTSHPWNELPEEMMVHSMTYLDVRTLVEIKLVSRQWQHLATTVIDSKGIGTNQRKAFESNEELRNAVRRYCPLPDGKGTFDYLDLNEDENLTQQYCHRNIAEEIASTYGWPINKWDVSNIEDFSNVFCFEIRYRDENRWVCFNLIKLFNEDISSWDVSNATSMVGMFRNANKFNQDLSFWDVSNVTNMKSMFSNAVMFNQDLSNWDTSNVTNMQWMFCSAQSFNQDLSSWDTSIVTDMGWMFFKAPVFNGDIRSWITSNVTNMKSMFHNAVMFNQDLSNWDTSNVTNMQWMFCSAESFNQDLSSWDTSNVRTRMRYIFDGSSTATTENFDPRI